MTSPHLFARAVLVPAVALVGLVAGLVLAGCSDDGAVTDIEPDGSRPGQIDSFADVHPDISPKGYAALGCAIHAAVSDVDPAALVNRTDPTQAAYQASTSLLIAAGLWNSEAYGDLVEPADTLVLTHEQGEWDLVADSRNALTGACGDIGSSPVGPHVYAAYACAIAGRVSDTAPTPRDIATNRLTPTEDEIDALTHLARAAGAEAAYDRLSRRAERLHLTRVDPDLREDYAQRLKRVRATCADLG